MSLVKAWNIGSSKLSGIYLKERRRHLDQGRVSEKIYSLKNSRRAYIGKITENINKLTKYMDLGNKSSLEFKTCLQKLQKCKHKIKMVLGSLIELTNDPDKLQNISDIYTQQDFRVIEITKSVSIYNASPLKFIRADDERFSITSYSTKWKSKHATKSRISLVSTLLKRRKKLHIFQSINVEKLQNTHNLEYSKPRKIRFIRTVV